MVDQPTELPSGIGVALSFSSYPGWRAFIKIVQATADISPAERRDDKEVKRALYARCTSSAILNFSSRRILQMLRNPVAIMTLEVDDPKVAADMAMKIFGEYGFDDAELIDGFTVDLGTPAKFKYIVVAAALPPILFLPKTPDPELVAHIPVPEPWVDDE